MKRIELNAREALKIVKEQGENFKVELISDLPDEETISFTDRANLWILCAGPHLPSTGRLNFVKLLNLAGAYWRGDENNPMLQRIYGTAFPKKKMMKEYLHFWRKLGNVITGSSVANWIF